jgi:uncharacterized Zn finger protein
MEKTWRSLTWEDLETWAGAKSLKKGRSYRSHVSQFGQTKDGGYLAWVQGSERYITHVEIKQGQLESRCSCPVGTRCKHAVAVVLVGLEQIKNKKPVALVNPDDPRWLLLETPVDRLEHRPEPQNSLETYLAGLPEPQLRALLEEVLQRFPNVRQLLQDRANMQGADGQKLLNTAKKEIAKLSSFSSYDDYHAIPDTERLTNALEGLNQGQHFDPLLGLAPSLMKASNQAIESCHDEGELHEALQHCFDLIIDALPQSSLGRSERLIWLEQLTLDDEYDLIETSAEDEEFWQDDPPQPQDWEALAEHFSLQLKHSDVKQYRRKRISDLIGLALRQAGRGEEITALLEREAEQHGEYSRLVEHYLELGQPKNADAAILRGMQQPSQSGSYGLQQKWRALREKEQAWEKLAADSAEDFLRDPSIRTFRQLETDAQKAKVWGKINPLARAFLETGKTDLLEWGLPKTGLPKDTKKTTPPSFPQAETLLRLAITEQNADQVLRWYRPSNRFGYGSQDDDVATAIAHAYPERAIEIWTGMVERLVAQTGQSSYVQSLEYLKKIRAVRLQHQQTEQWEGLLNSLYTTHKRKPRFIELLQGLRGKSIVDT